MKTIAKMKSDSEQIMKLEWLYKVGSECQLNWYDMVWELVQVRASERNSVILGSNSTPTNFLSFYSYYRESFGSEYHICLYIYLLIYICIYIYIYKHRDILKINRDFEQVFTEFPIIAFRRNKNLKAKTRMLLARKQSSTIANNY